MVKSKYQLIIEAFCIKENVTIPSGFYRHSAGHLAIIKSTDLNKQLVARTWIKNADVINYLANYGSNECQVFDFKKGVELAWNGAKLLTVKSEL
ncbi:hypothetical protein C2869_03990 [Saccharobesus litoralis]|uniref:Uncharacterized protein n=1 Tax=Saccharobesus litoralis TaxID=2172099 RepID=A0A2S0VN48_9ALTE|nr:hypothetical protein [Saccharobesus litoralis]AWB65647.1 hypothetical protein C2869_03990 [Saccharobesus litoralis]